MAATWNEIIAARQQQRLAEAEARTVPPVSFGEADRLSRMMGEGHGLYSSNTSHPNHWHPVEATPEGRAELRRRIEALRALVRLGAIRQGDGKWARLASYQP
jgi:hypothetical protein